MPETVELVIEKVPLLLLKKRAPPLLVDTFPVIVVLSIARLPLCSKRMAAPFELRPPVSVRPLIVTFSPAPLT